MRYLGIDYGEKDVGVALSDEGGSMAFPQGIYKNGPTFAKRIADLIEKEGVTGVVVGLSSNNENEENPIMKEARVFAKELETLASVKIFFEPEYYTSQEARHSHDGVGKLDASAAAIILNSYLKKQNPKSVLDE